MDDCIFCKIIRGEIPSGRVLEDDEFIAIHDINPKAPVHLLVMPREHLASLNDIGCWTGERAQKLLEFVVAVARAAGISESGYRVISNVGRDAGQQVDHLHLHVLGGARLGGLL